MSDSNNHDNGDSKADAIASVVIICVVVTAVVYWLSSMWDTFVNVRHSA